MKLRVEYRSLLIVMREVKYRFLIDLRDWQWIFPWKDFIPWPALHAGKRVLQEIRIGPLEVRKIPMQRRTQEK